MNIAGVPPVSGPSEGSRPPALDGELTDDPDALDAAATDFGGLVTRQPRWVARPASTADIAAVVRWAAGLGLPLAARGQGHSVYGRSLVEDGVVLDLSGFRTVHEVGGDRVVVDAGATWGTVLAATLPHGLTPPVLPDYLELSVGGTVSAGGIGGTTHRHGAASCQVIELDVVTGDGRALTCSRDRHRDLFDAVRGGLSQCAVITRATLRLVPAMDRARQYTLRYRDLPALTADQRLLLAAQRVDVVQGAVLVDGDGWRHQLEAAVLHSQDARPDDDLVLAGLSDERADAAITELSYVDFLNRLSPLEKHLRSIGRWSDPHPWFTSFVGGSAVDDLVGGVLADLTGADLGEFGRIVLSPLRADRFATPLLRLPDEDVVFQFNVLRFPPNDAELARRMATANRALYDLVRATGGTGYPVSAVALAQADWAAHFGPAWPGLREAKDRFDPRHILAPGQGIG
ncbi:FAD-binding protein [Solihabitans fulvus]|uniref:FAD-binding protein n=1 Tax=Solihabitans fulvus TaxID=1892852 RepID=A0A5B2XUJ7_9PSEU|nr:FAD-binding protein [Solihabitans fulvus]KAA2266431.1 FAD-binding protein [Solihabitans fulvus]